jgi:hypothetical protein
MNARERINAVIHHQKPDKVPFVPLDEYVPRGDLTRELRNRGMGIWTRTPLWWSERPNVTIETKRDKDKVTTIAHTPVGSVTSRSRTHLSREATTGRALGREGWIKSIEDYDPVLFMIEDEVFYQDYAVYDWLTRELGGDGVVRGQRFVAPYWQAYRYFGPSSPVGAENFIYHQIDHPDHFSELVKALERRNERLFPIVANSPVELLEIGSINAVYGPKQYKQYFIPFYEKYVPLFREKGKILYPHAHSSHLKSYVDLIPQMDVDMLDAFTPPPVGDLSLAEARNLWADQMIIAVNFPETIFWGGPEATRKYTRKLLEENMDGPLVIGMTEVGTSMIVDDKMEQAFKTGMIAIMDAIDEYCG